MFDDEWERKHEERMDWIWKWSKIAVVIGVVFSVLVLVGVFALIIAALVGVL